MRPIPPVRNRRWLAIVLLLIVVLTVYLLGVHWWFVAPHLDISDQMNDLREQQQRYDQIVQQRGDIDKRLAEVHGFEQNNQAFLNDVDAPTAFSDLSQRLKQAFDQHQDSRCQITGTSPSPSRDVEVYQRVTAAVVMTCDTETFAAILYDLENSNPYLFVDRLVLYRQQQPFFQTNPKVPPPPQTYTLGIQFNLSGYLRQPGKTTP